MRKVRRLSRRFGGKEAGEQAHPPASFWGSGGVWGGWFRSFLAGSLARQLVIWVKTTVTKERECDPFRAGLKEGERRPAEEMLADESGVSVHVPSVRVRRVRVI